ncbi:unnamed protein product [Vicia faba]|uniref:Uncharacterized protein n=1 Tax=Vicia faba TaxID=3906 RepID=A0AAV1AGK5_VICFA|nr:unnamed protein product [Vicia faba]CAI8608813.1 unnamed protein product [Vicia faba]
MTKKYHHQLQIFMKDVMKRNELTASLGNDELVFILISLKLSVFIGDILAANSSHSEFFNLSKQFWSITPEELKKCVDVLLYEECPQFMYHTYLKNLRRLDTYPNLIRFLLSGK